MCGSAFALDRALARPSDSRSPIVGTIVCSAACVRRFDREIGGNIVLHDFGTTADAAPICRDCRSVLEHVVDDERCRLCRLRRTIRKRIRGEAKRLARQRRVVAAQKAFGLAQTPWEIVE
jgi:hypothetical protein